VATTLCNGTRPGFTTGVIQPVSIENHPADSRVDAVVYGISPYHSNCMKSDNPHSGYYEADTARTLDALQCGYPGCNQGGMAVVQPVGTFQETGIGWWNDEDIGATLRALSGGDAMKANLVVAGVDCRNGTEYEEQTGALQSSAYHNMNSNNVGRVRYIVRRLTPLECERLQGYPDGWTDIGEWVDSKGKKHKEADSPRYKALGNSIAIPPWKWVLKRLCACYERDATMASLFDGIGGFPYIWEQLNGKGSCLWASEIEEFPMAVTKLRFGGNTNV
jgi:DNA (cytosine-5)-methyltransferase 1